LFFVTDPKLHTDQIAFRLQRLDLGMRQQVCALLFGDACKSVHQLLSGADAGGGHVERGVRANVRFFREDL
jgi:hypothetical protein